MGVNFEWIDMNEETFKIIERKGTRSSVNVLAINDKASCLIGRIYKESDGYSLITYIGGGFDNVMKFVKVEDILPDGYHEVLHTVQARINDTLRKSMDSDI